MNGITLKKRFALSALCVTLTFGIFADATALTLNYRNTNNLYYFGQHMHRLVYDDPTDPDTTIANGLGATVFPGMRADGGLPVGTIRTWDSGASNIWSSLEPAPGIYDWARLDTFVNTVVAHGGQVLHTISPGTPAWASARPTEPFVYGAGGAAEPDLINHIQDYENFLTKLFTRYKGKIKFYELWNEPNFCGSHCTPDPKKNQYFGYTGTAATLFSLHQIAHRILHSIDPKAKLLSPGFVGQPVAGDGLPAYLDASIAADANQSIESFNNNTDIIAYHYYAASPEDSLYLHREILSTLKHYNVATKPIFNTESGFFVAPAGSLDSSQQPGYLARSYIMGLYEGLERFIYYDYEGNSGLFSAPDMSRISTNAAQAWPYEGQTNVKNPPGTLYAAGLAQEQISKWLQGTTFGKCFYAGDSIVYCDIVRNTDPTWTAVSSNSGSPSLARLIWRTDNNTSTFTIPATWNWPSSSFATTLVTLDGPIAEEGTTSNVTKTVSISPNPTLLATIPDWGYQPASGISSYEWKPAACPSTAKNAASYVNLILSGSPTAYYRMGAGEVVNDPVKGWLIKDSSPNHLDAFSNHANNTSAPQFDSIAGPIVGTTKLLHFDANEYVNIPSFIPGAMDASGKPTDFSIEFWGNLAANFTDSMATFAGDYLATGFRIGAYLLPGSTSAVGWQLWTTQSGGQISVSSVLSSETQTEQWAHITMTYSAASQTFKIYINGRLTGHQAGTYHVPTNTPGLIVGSVAGQHFDGNLAEYAIYNRALGSNEILKHYQIGSGNCDFQPL